MLEKLEVNVSIMCLKVTYMFKVGYSWSTIWISKIMVHFFESLLGFLLIWILFIFVHGLYYHLTNDTSLNYQFNICKMDFVWIVFGWKVSHSTMHKPMKKSSKLSHFIVLNEWIKGLFELY
jgi:hypothetical protein